MAHIIATITVTGLSPYARTSASGLTTDGVTVNHLLPSGLTGSAYHAANQMGVACSWRTVAPSVRQRLSGLLSQLSSSLSVCDGNQYKQAYLWCGMLYVRAVCTLCMSVYWIFTADGSVRGRRLQAHPARPPAALCQPEGQ